MINVLYSEYDATHRANFVFDIPEGQNSWLLILTHTPAVFLVGDNYEEYPPNTVVLYQPMQRIYYRACEDRYGNDWIRFVTDETFVTQTPIQCGMPFMPQDPLYLHKLFQLIAIEHDKNEALKDVIIDKLLQVMFHKIVPTYEGQRTTLMSHNISELKNEIYIHPNKDWTIKLMTEKCNISAGYLESVYKSTFGVSCMEDVINSRISMAKKHLRNSVHSISEIAALCGYRSAEHFYRQFKKITGMTPKNYRDLPAK